MIKKTGALAVACTTLLWGGKALAQEDHRDKTPERTEFVEALEPCEIRIDDVYVLTDGLGRGTAVPDGRVWATTINDDAAPNDWTNVGLRTNGFAHSSAQPMPATLSFTVDVRTLEGGGQAYMTVRIFEDGQFMQGPAKTVGFSSTGMNTIRSDLFMMAPNRVYHALVLVGANAPANHMKGVSGQITRVCLEMQRPR